MRCCTWFPLGLSMDTWECTLECKITMENKDPILHLQADINRQADKELHTKIDAAVNVLMDLLKPYFNRTNFTIECKIMTPQWEVAEVLKNMEENGLVISPREHVIQTVTAGPIPMEHALKQMRDQIFMLVQEANRAAHTKAFLEKINKQE